MSWALEDGFGAEASRVHSTAIAYAAEQVL